MKKIGILSDTHGFLDPKVFYHFQNCDEVWHAGDFGTEEVAQALSAFKPLRAVWGNIDDPNLRKLFPEDTYFSCEQVSVFMTHIGGHPGKYPPHIRRKIRKKKPKLFVCGHSHILRILYDHDLQCLYLNPGAAGQQGFHKKRTLVRLTITDDRMHDCEVIDLGLRGRLTS